MLGWWRWPDLVERTHSDGVGALDQSIRIGHDGVTVA